MPGFSGTGYGEKPAPVKRLVFLHPSKRLSRSTNVSKRICRSQNRPYAAFLPFFWEKAQDRNSIESRSWPSVL